MRLIIQPDYSSIVEYNPTLESIEITQAAIFFERNYSFEYVGMFRLYCLGIKEKNHSKSMI